MLWSTVSKAGLRSSSTNREIQPLSDDNSRPFVTLMRAVSVLLYGLNPDWNLDIYHFSQSRNKVVRPPFLLSEKGDWRL